MPTKQAAAAVGQCELMYTYDKLFNEYNHTVAQVLLTGEDVRSEQRSRNMRNTIFRLLELGALPVINENDTVATDEVGVENTIGENDTLSAIVAAAVHADLLILLSDIDGLYDGDPHKDANAHLISTVPAVDEHILALGGGDPEILNIVDDITHQSATDIMTAKGLVDLLIPRGGAGLIRACVEGASVPCIETGTGICHVYVDKAADLDKALAIVENAKTSRPSVCNAEEVLLVHSAVAAEFLPRLKKRLVDDRAAAGKTPVELRLDERAAAIIPGTPTGERDFDTEFLNYILAVAVVDSVEEAVAHILTHSTGHSEAIVTEDPAAAEVFVSGTDSAAVYVNASTRFTDGGEFGLGCEMGISTQKLHARGPMGLDELSTYKYVVLGSGQIR